MLHISLIALSFGGMSCSEYEKATEENRAKDEPHPALLEKDEENRTPLMFAAFTKDNDRVAELVSREVDLEVKDSNGQTALMFAVHAGNSEGVKILLAAGAVVDTRDNQNSTPLMLAALHGFRGAVTALLAAGASPRKEIMD